MAGALYSGGHAALLGGRDACLAARAQLAAVGDELAQKLDVLVIDLLGIADDDLNEGRAHRALIAPALATGFDDVLVRVSALELGPPVGWPLKFRVSGRDPNATREYAHAFAQAIGANANVRNINYD